MKDSQDYFLNLENIIIVSLSRDFKRRFNEFGDSSYKELVCALKTNLWTQLKVDFPQANPVINIILPNIDFGVCIKDCPESRYLMDQRVMQDCLDEACRSLALAVRL